MLTSFCTPRANLLMVATLHFRTKLRHRRHSRETWVRASVRLPTLSMVISLAVTLKRAHLVWPPRRSLTEKNNQITTFRKIFPRTLELTPHRLFAHDGASALCPELTGLSVNMPITGTRDWPNSWLIDMITFLHKSPSANQPTMNKFQSWLTVQGLQTSAL